MSGGAVEVASYAAPAGERGEGMPVAGYGLMALSWRPFAPRSDTLFVRSSRRSWVNRKTVLIAAQPGAQRVSGVVPVVPVPAAGYAPHPPKAAAVS